MKRRPAALAASTVIGEGEYLEVFQVCSNQTPQDLQTYDESK